MPGYHEQVTTSTTNFEIAKTCHLIDGSPKEMGLFLEDLRMMLKDGLLSLCTAAGLSVLQTLMEADVTALAGPKGKHLLNRTAYRHGTEHTRLSWGARRVASPDLVSGLAGSKGKSCRSRPMRP